MAPPPAEQDHVDAFLARIHLAFPDLDLEVEGIVDRIGGINRRINRMLDETLAEVGLDHGEYKVLSFLSQSGPPFRSTPGRLAKRMELSSGAMTNRLDRLEEADLVRRLPDPEDRRSVVVELTDHGRETIQKMVGAQAQKEALLAMSLSAREQKQLNGLLRKVMLEFERRGGDAAETGRGGTVARPLRLTRLRRTPWRTGSCTCFRAVRRSSTTHPWRRYIPAEQGCRKGKPFTQLARRLVAGQ